MYMRSKITLIECIECGTKVERAHSRSSSSERRFCSHKCAMKSYNRLVRYHMKFPHKCVICGKDYTSTGFYSKTCSYSCRGILIWQTRTKNGTTGEKF